MEAEVQPSAPVEEQAAITPEVAPDVPVEMHPTEEAAMKFTKLLPYVRKFSAIMTGKGLSRVMHAIAEFPLGATKPRLLNENERQLFHIMQELQGYKSTVIQEIIKQQHMPKAAEMEIKNESSESQVEIVAENRDASQG